MTGYRKLTLKGSLFEVEGAKAIVHIIHGMKEHRKRYHDFMAYLQRNRIASICYDQRGHGESLSKEYPLGHMENMDELLRDQEEIFWETRKKYENIPYIIVGHSFGSLIARQWIRKYNPPAHGLILSGAPHFQGISAIGLVLQKLLDGQKPSHHKNPIITKIGEFDDISWVCANEKTMEEYRKDPLCTGYTYTDKAHRTVWESVWQLKFPQRIDNLHLKKVLFLAGEDDPITGGPTGINDSIGRLKKQGYLEIKSIVYPKMKHEILNERNRKEVYWDILNFIETIEKHP
ncbi:MAG: alpha/beta fold hydrolase [Tissierellia bacterium]|nr:alpha/beta fold hydrolase [Tissierellia bacterium]